MRMYDHLLSIKIWITKLLLTYLGDIGKVHIRLRLPLNGDTGSQDMNGITLSKKTILINYANMKRIIIKLESQFGRLH